MGKIYTWPSLLSPVWVSCGALPSQPVKKCFSGTIHLIWNSELQRDLWQTPLLFRFNSRVSRSPCLCLPTLRALVFTVCSEKRSSCCSPQLSTSLCKQRCSASSWNSSRTFASVREEHNARMSSRLVYLVCRAKTCNRQKCFTRH